MSGWHRWYICLRKARLTQRGCRSEVRRLKRSRLEKQKVRAIQHFSLTNHPDARVAMLEPIDPQKWPRSGSMSTLYVESRRKH